MESTLNVRMDAPLKQRGDAVLRAHGISTSGAVRALWQYMADTHEVPAFMKQDNKELRRQAKVAALLELAGSAKGSLSNATDAELAALGMARYQ